MKERPIIFSAPMVRALLDGRKTQTRRICKTMNAWVDQSCREVRHVDEVPHHFLKGAITPIERLRCPYGQPGDRLWVREAFATLDLGCVGHLYYRADFNGGTRQPCGKWVSGRYMPRHLSRLTLEVVTVRVERVQEISEADALAEGALQFDSPTTFVRDGVQSIYLPNMGYALSAFRELWDSINAKRAPWESNPWAWVIEFRVIEREARG